MQNFPKIGLFLFAAALICLSLNTGVNSVLAEEENPDGQNKVIEEESKINPAQNYRLVGIYIIEDKPRAIIRNLSMLEDGPKEFITGDYLDEMETISVSKISLTPTSRVELIDNEGFSYLMKPDTNADSAKAAAKSNVTPTYSGKSYKYKSKKKKKKKKKAVAKKADDKKADTPAAAPDAMAADTSMAEAAPAMTAEAPAAMTADTMAAPAKTEQKKESVDAFGRSRPSNPFDN